MNAILLSSLLALGADPQTAGQTGRPAGGQAQTGGQIGGRDNDRAGANRVTSTSAKIDGEWTVVYMEKDGHKSDAGKSAKVTIRNNTVTFTDGGKEHTLRLQFGPMHTIVSYPADNSRGTGNHNSTDRGSTDRNSSDRNAGTGNRTTGTGDRNTGTADRNTGTSDRNTGAGNRSAGTAAAGTSTSSGADQGTHRGVYVLSQEYLVISMDSGMTGGAGTGTGTGTRPGAGTGSGASTPGERPAAGERPASGDRPTGAGAGARTGAGTGGGAGNDDRPQANPAGGAADRQTSVGAGTPRGTGTGIGSSSGTGADLLGGQPQTSPFVLILRKASSSGSSSQDNRK